MSELEKIERIDREAFESWGCEKKAVAGRGDRNCCEHARVEVDEVELYIQANLAK